MRDLKICSNYLRLGLAWRELKPLLKAHSGQSNVQSGMQNLDTPKKMFTKMAGATTRLLSCEEVLSGLGEGCIINLNLRSTRQQKDPFPEPFMAGSKIVGKRFARL